MRLGELVARLKSELGQVSDRLGKAVGECAELRVKLRKFEDSSGHQDIEQKMLEKVQDLEKSNLETLLKTYKGGFTRPNLQAAVGAQGKDARGRGAQEGSRAHQGKPRGTGQPGKAAQAVHRRPAKRKPGAAVAGGRHQVRREADFKRVESVLGEIRHSERQVHVSERRACIEDIESMINSYKFGLHRPKRGSRRGSVIQ